MSNHPQTKRHLVIAAVMASMAMVAIEATIVSTAMPQIVTQLGGLRLYSWVFSSFLLAQTAMTVVFGKLADLYGRKPTVLVGIAIFLIGSIGAGFAWSMPAMIVFRLIQGMGAGAIQPVTLTIVADLYPARERGKIQGYLASVWAISAVIGPMAGGLLIRDLSWSWIFWINVPIGILAAVGFISYLHEEKRHQRPSIDIMGAVLFTIAIGALMPASIMAIACGNLFTRNIYKDFINPACSPQAEARMAKFIAFAAKLGALFFVLELQTTYAIQLQLLGGIWICQTVPAVLLALYVRLDPRALLAGWAAGVGLGTWMVADLAFKSSTYPLHIFGVTVPCYAAVSALLVNLAVSWLLTVILRATVGVQQKDETVAADYA